MIVDPTTGSQYLFCFANIWQGVYIFYHHCLGDPEICQVYKAYFLDDDGSSFGNIKRRNFTSTKDDSRHAQSARTTAAGRAGARGPTYHKEDNYNYTEDGDEETGTKRDRRTTDYFVVTGEDASSRGRASSDDFVTVAFSKHHTRILLDDGDRRPFSSTSTGEDSNNNNNNNTGNNGNNGNNDNDSGYLRKIRGPNGKNSIELDFSGDI